MIIDGFKITATGYILLVLINSFLISCQRPEPVEPVNGNCPVGSVMIGRYCVVSVGTICKGAEDCISGFCMENYNERYCTQKCEYDYDCPSGYFCSKVGDEKLCLKSIYSRTVCSQDSECEPCGMCINGLCELSTFCIVTLCETDVDCGSCRSCSDGRCVPIERCGRSCISNMDCNPDQICDRDYQGRLACLPRIPAETGMYCEGKNPELECKSKICLFADGYPYSYCSKECSDNSDCPYDYYCGIFPTYKGKKVCIKKGIYEPRECSSSRDCNYDLKCRYTYTYDKNGISTFCGILNDAPASQQYCNDYYECKWGMCGRLTYCKDSCRNLCTMPCKDDSDCPESFVCEDLISSSEDVLYRGCVNYQELKKDVGEFCTYSDEECRSNICVKNSDIPYCSKYCQDDSDCPSNFVCDYDLDRLVCKREVSENVCYNDNDCPEDMFCSFVETEGEGKVKCLKPQGEFSQVGEVCDKTCASGICLYEYNICSAFCKEMEDCPSDFICVFAALNTDDYNKTIVKICIPNPGSLYQCIRDEGCPDKEVCRIYFDGRSGEVEPVCMKPYSTLKDYNEVCYSNEECLSGVCLPDRDTDITDGFYGRCTRFCAIDGDCLDGDICRIVPVYFSRDYARATRVCAPKPISSETGQSCKDDPYICDSGFCANIDNSNSFCTERCRDHYDCSKSLTVCRLVDKIGTVCLPVTYIKEE